MISKMNIIYLLATLVLAGTAVYSLGMVHEERTAIARMSAASHAQAASDDDNKHPLHEPVPAVANVDPNSIARLVYDRVRGELGSERDGEASVKEVSSTPARHPTTAEVRDSLEARFYGESNEPQWARDAQLRARAHIMESLPTGSTVRDVQCRASLCRVETLHTNEETYQEFLQSTMRAAPWEGQVMMTVLRRGDDGSVTSVAYLGRKESGPLVVDEGTP
jgi:hypothetical protein